MNKYALATLPRRPYKDGVELSIVAFGAIVVCGETQDKADAYVAEAVDRGVNYFDVAPSYFDGEAELKLGIALKPWRKDAFLACKTEKRDAAGAQDELERSLERLHTDHFDLYQFHAITTKEDVDRILGPKGAGETFLKAQKAGKVRYLGFSAHSVEAALALMDAFPCDSALFPLNFVTLTQGNFGQQILDKAKAKGVARLALKSMAYSPWGENETHSWTKTWYKPAPTPDLREKALRFTLGLDITAAIPPGHYELYREALDIATTFKPLSPAEEAELRAAAKGVEPLFRA
jgi:aryl-alcohol dehydrogenase-like predicted oxidoreductase